MKKAFFTYLFIFSLITSSLAQDDDVNLYDLSLEDLMNITIVSASNKEESIFDAPLSSHSITKEDIIKSGATSIPEALRLSPGLIVREQTNGNFDIHIRGFDNVSRFSQTFDRINKITLVMIDDRPVYNYNYGGTFWESLPIDLIDVERIEIVNGPSAPLFGPNAVAGVINIITSRATKKGAKPRANVQYGTNNTLISNVSIGNKVSDKFSYTISGNYQLRERHDELYYGYDDDVYFPLAESDLLGDIEKPEQSMNKGGINAFLNFKPVQDATIDLSIGYQSARVQQLFLTPTSPTFNNSNSLYSNLDVTYKGLSARLSYTTGFDELGEVSGIGLSTEYDFNVSNATLDYTWVSANKKLEIVPSFNYQGISYNDEDYISEGISGLYNKEVSISILGGGLKLDYNPIKSLRLVGALRLDSYNVPDDSYLSYQFMATFKPMDKVLLRAVHANSNSSSFMINSFLNADVFVAPSETTGPIPLILQFRGDENLALTQNTMNEIGFRWQAKPNLQIDFAAFHQRLYDLSKADPIVPPSINVPIVDNVPRYDMPFLTNPITYENLSETATQIGITASVNWLPSEQWQIRPFVTFQKTNVDNLTRLDLITDNIATLLPQVPPGGSLPIGTIERTLIDTENGSTPNYFGGIFINYRPMSKLNINMNPYFMSSYEIYHEEDLTRLSTEGQIGRNLILNAKISYEIIDDLNVYLNGRNIGGNSREYYGTDKITGLYLLGASYNF